jgi:hypothetical protein
MQGGEWLRNRRTGRGRRLRSPGSNRPRRPRRRRSREGGAHGPLQHHLDRHHGAHDRGSRRRSAGEGGARGCPRVWAQPRRRRHGGATRTWTTSTSETTFGEAAGWGHVSGTLRRTDRLGAVSAGGGRGRASPETTVRRLQRGRGPRLRRRAYPIPQAASSNGSGSQAAAPGASDVAAVAGRTVVPQPLVPPEAAEEPLAAPSVVATSSTLA